MKNVLACLPVSRGTPPTVDSVQMQCINCNAAVWLAVTSLTMPNVDIWCIDCAQREFPEMEPEMTPETRYEVVQFIMRRYGVPEAVAEKMADRLAEIAKAEARKGAL